MQILVTYVKELVQVETGLLMRAKGSQKTNGASQVLGL